MRVRKLNDDGDLATNGEMFIFDAEAIGQTIRTRLKLYLGEYFRDIDDGTPWFQSILGKFENISAVEALLRSRISETEGVIRLLSFDLEYSEEARSLSVSGEVLTEFGIQDFEVTNG